MLIKKNSLAFAHIFTCFIYNILQISLMANELYNVSDKIKFLENPEMYLLELKKKIKI